MQPTRTVKILKECTPYKQQMQFIFFVSIVITGTILMMRSSTTEPLIGPEPYSHLRIAHLLESGAISDPHIAEINRLTYTAYDILVLLFITFFTDQIASILLPAGIAIGISLTIYLILRKLSIPDYLLYTILGLYMISPIGLYYATTSQASSFAFLLELLGIYSYMRQKRLSIALGSIGFGIAASIQLAHLIITSIFLIGYTVSNRRTLQHLFIAIIITGITLIILQQSEMIVVTPAILLLEPHTYIVEFGSVSGISLFLLAFGAWGLIQRFKTFFLLSLATLGSILLINLPGMTGYTTILLAVMSSYAIWNITTRMYTLHFLKRWCMLLILCSLIFSTAVSIKQLIRAEPSNETILATKQMIPLTNPGEIILTSPEHSYFLQYSNFTTLIDMRHINSPQNEELHGVITSFDSELIKVYLEKNKIIAIYMTPELNLPGIQYNLLHSEMFKKEFEVGNTVLWRLINHESSI